MEKDKKGNKENKVEEPITGYGTGYTYADYLKFEFDEMVELIKGKIFKMSPAPKSYHQRISANLTLIFGVFLKEKSCELYYAPFDVVLPINNKTKNNSTTVVQPDICVICDLSKIDEAGCFGAPDFIIEIISKSTSKKDLNDKYAIYQVAGVKEYWIVFPKKEQIKCYVLDNEIFRLNREYVKGEIATTYLFPNFAFAVDEVFLK